MVTAPREGLARWGLEASGVRWTSGRPEPQGAAVEVRIRHRHRPVTASVHVGGEDRIRVLFEAPEAAVTPGQAAVLYRGDEVLGGGWIVRALGEDEARAFELREAACE